MSAHEVRACLHHPNPIQLELIGEIHRELAARSIPHWLGGGWALDFLLGEVLRVHGDVDWAIWKRDAGAPRRDVDVVAIEKLREYLAGNALG